MEEKRKANNDTAAVSRNRNDGGDSGGHLRHGHFVLSPCSPSASIREEATYVLQLVLVQRLHCFTNDRHFS